MEWLHLILLIAGGLLGISGLIIAKKPDAKQHIDKLVPFQAFIGVALIGVGLVQLLRFGPINVFRALGPMPIVGLTLIAGIFGGILLGFLFGMPQISKWIPGESNAENKAMEFSKKIAPYQMILGLVCLGAAALMLLLELKILKPY